MVDMATLPTAPVLPAVGLILPEAQVDRATGFLMPSWPMFRIEGRLYREDIEEAVEQLVRLLDLTARDPDLESPGAEDDFEISAQQLRDADDGPGCVVADPDREEEGADVSCTEWHTRGRFKLNPGVVGKDGWPLREDDEEDDGDTSVEDGKEGFDPEEDCCPAGDDRVFSGPASSRGMYREDFGPGDEVDAEHWDQTDNVPMLPVVTAEHNPFTDRRVPLGLGNLQSSYRTNGGEVRSADSGDVHSSKGWETGPGVPV